MLTTSVKKAATPPIRHIYKCDTIAAETAQESIANIIKLSNSIVLPKRIVLPPTKPPATHANIVIPAKPQTTPANIASPTKRTLCAKTASTKKKAKVTWKDNVKGTTLNDDKLSDDNKLNGDDLMKEDDLMKGDDFITDDDLEEDWWNIADFNVGANNTSIYQVNDVFVNELPVSTSELSSVWNATSTTAIHKDHNCKVYLHIIATKCEEVRNLLIDELKHRNISTPFGATRYFHVKMCAVVCNNIILKTKWLLLVALQKYDITIAKVAPVDVLIWLHMQSIHLQNQLELILTSMPAVDTPNNVQMAFQLVNQQLVQLFAFACCDVSMIFSSDAFLSGMTSECSELMATVNAQEAAMTALCNPDNT